MSIKVVIVTVIHYRIPICLYFTPKSDDEVNFNISCLVKKKIEPLRLNVKVGQINLASLVEDFLYGFFAPYTPNNILTITLIAVTG